MSLSFRRQALTCVWLQEVCPAFDWVRKASQDEEQTSAPGVAAYLLASGEVVAAVEALISQGALGDCTEGLPASCAFDGLVNKGLGWPCAPVPCTHRQFVGCGKQGDAYMLKAWPASCD